MATFDVAKLLNKIKDDIPGLNTVLKALAKWDVSSLTETPDGAMRAEVDATGRMVFQRQKDGSYTPINKLMHDVDTVDGYHAGTGTTPGALPVRDANGALPGNITGNAATAAEAGGLAAGVVVPVNQGGTEATTASAARDNLGITAISDSLEAHVDAKATASAFSHVKLDALAADGTATAAPGGFGLGTNAMYAADLNEITRTGLYKTTSETLNSPFSVGYVLAIIYESTYSAIQLGFAHYSNQQFGRHRSSGVWQNWNLLPGGITDAISTTSPNIAASATAVKTAYDLAESRAPGGFGLGAAWGLYPPGNDLNNVTSTGWVRSDSTVANSPPSATTTGYVMTIAFSPTYRCQISYTHNHNGNFIRFMDAGSWGAWRRLADSAVGDLHPSLATTRPGGLLCNGGAISRTTYAILFSAIGTTFGAGDGSTTFNLPDLRNRTVQGANGNLMAYLEAGLPNITGALAAIRNANATAGGTGSGVFEETASTAGGVSGGNSQSYRNYNFSAQRSNSIYGHSTTVQPPSLAVNWFIQYQ